MQSNTVSRRWYSTWSRGIVAAALLLLPACGDLFPWHEPAVRVYVSEAVSHCPAADTLCVLLTPIPADSQVLAQLSGDTIPGTARLERATGIQWTEPRVRDDELHIDFPPPPPKQKRSVYVVEVVRAESAHDSVLSIASNGGTVVWLNGTLLGASRSASRGARAHQDIYTAALRQGTNVLLYRVHNNGVDAQLHREWHTRTALPDLLAASIDLGAYATLVREPLLPDSATSIQLWPPQVRLRDGPVVHFQWLTLLGDSLGGGGQHDSIYPDKLPLPEHFEGMAVLRTEVLDAASGERLYVEESPIFTDSTAQRLARLLATDSLATDPVRAARVDAVRALFNLRPVSLAADPGGWIKVQVLASLYRHVRQPDAFQRYPGPQVWGYRAADGSVQPYWLTVPPNAGDPVEPLHKPGLLHSVNHHNNVDFWAGRGRMGGFLVHLATMTSRYGAFGVMPHLGGVQDFDSLAVEELSAITHQVGSTYTIDTAAVGMLVWSSHALEAVQMAQDPRVSVAWLGMAVPGMRLDRSNLSSVLDSLHVIRPQLRWLVWQASEDTIVLRENTEKWVGHVRKKGFDVRYRVVPYSTHLGGFFEDVEADLHRSVAFRHRGATARARRDSLPDSEAADRP